MKFVKSLAQSSRGASRSSHAPRSSSALGKPQSAHGARDRIAAAKSRLKKVPDTDSGFLRRARIRKSSTRRTYAEAWKQFIVFCTSSNFLAAPSCKFVSMQQLDRAMEAFGEHLFLSGDSKYLLTCALQNCNIEYPQWPTSSRTNYPLSKAAKKGWSNMEPGASRDPCPFEVACWISMDMLVRGLVYHAAAVMLCFDTYVRPGKVCELKHHNIVPPSRGINTMYKQWTLLLNPQELLTPSKTGEYNDSLHVGYKGREWIGTLLGKLYARHSGKTDGALFPFSLNNFETEFRNSVSSLKLQKLRLSPHCLRHGGASHDYLKGHSSLQDIQQRGCWATFASVQRYSKHGRLTKQLALLTAKQQAAARQASLQLPSMLVRSF